MNSPRNSQSIILDTGWTRYQTQAGEIQRPSELSAAICGATVRVPENVIATPNPDDDDWWYKLPLPPELKNRDGIRLCFEGLATICEVWLDDDKLLTTRNMFRRHQLALPTITSDDVNLVLCFRSVSSDLAIKRKRPSWKTNLVNHQQLRWLRTSLLGRMPGWTPPQPIVGPFRPIHAEFAADSFIEKLSISGTVEDARCVATIDATVNGCKAIAAGKALLRIAGTDYEITTAVKDNSLIVRGSVDIDDVDPWFPHTHGTAATYDCALIIEYEQESFELWHGSVGFRSVALQHDSNRFTLSVNNTAVFCRGACWTTNDVSRYQDDEESLRRTLTLMQQAGANMIRIGGTMLYESELFHSLCDELGIMVWQDFMFANMDYPIADDEFRQDAVDEIAEQARRLLQHPSTVVFCGNSEVEQQAAMFGKERDEQRSALFYEIIPEQLQIAGSSLPYVPSSPCFGDLPFHNRTGVSHYFGVGAYKRPVDDVQNAGVLFTSECLGFSNFPDDPALVRHFGGTAPATHSPAWKSGVPRDAGAGWDFEDIRDHYLQALFGIDGPELRYFDKARYAALSRIVSGEVMQRAYAFWRSTVSDCSGAIVWFLKDLVPGAGWGIIDADNDPKPAYYFLKRAWQGLSMRLTDRGLDGIELGVVNEGEQRLTAQLDVSLIRCPATVIAAGSTDAALEQSEEFSVSIDKLLGRFFDPAYSYRFGPPKHDVVAAVLRDADGQLLATQCHFPGGYQLEQQANANVECEILEGDTGCTVRLTSDTFLQFAQLKARDWTFDDNFLNLVPGVTHSIVARRNNEEGRQLKIMLSALNLSRTLTLS
tara:strand:+ start:23808 stop:26276 length:2469 start_codon:yes stop_codon:yes gene_type:complete